MRALAIGERANTMTLSTVFAGRYAHGVGATPTITSNVDSLVTSSAFATERVHEVGIHVGSSLRY